MASLHYHANDRQLPYNSEVGQTTGYEKIKCPLVSDNKIHLISGNKIYTN